MRSRTQLTTALMAALPSSWNIEDSARKIPEPDAAVLAVVAVQRMTMEPAAHQGGLIERFNVWLLEPSLDIEYLEDLLEDNLEQLIAAIDGIPYITWTTAARDIYDDTYHAYRVEVTLASNRKA